MSAFLVAAATAFWLGLLTSISPCLLATNVAAVSFLARRAPDLRGVLLACTCYVVGQALAFVLLAALLTGSLLTVPLVSLLLQKYMFRLLGPILLLCAIFLLELWGGQLGNGRMKAWANRRAHGGGLGAAALLGIVFAMSFCPTTAALFFGSLVPLSIAQESLLLLPLAYAVGVALPVAVFSLLVAFAARWVGRAFARVGRAERWARYATGLIFLAVGLYFTLRYTLELF